MSGLFSYFFFPYESRFFAMWGPNLVFMGGAFWSLPPWENFCGRPWISRINATSEATVILHVKYESKHLCNLQNGKSHK